MTQQTLDDLDRLSNPQLAREAEQARNRSNFRPVWTKVTADIASVEGPYEATLNNGTKVQRCALKLVNMRNVEGETPFTGTEADLEFGLPTNPNVNSELVLTVASAQALQPSITSIRGLAGLKNVRLEERVHEFEGRQFVKSPGGGQTDRDGNRGDWKDATMTTRYYHVVSIGGGSNGATAPAVTDERLAEAAFLVSGLSHAEAMEALGADGAAVISKLVLNKKISQQEGVYQPVG